ncbi:MAG: potassium/proton antiporter [Actinomycetales bacterium]|nr:potassium/proton antiporter [Actinomycetales bacterium]
MTLEELAVALLIGASIVLVSVIGVRLAGRLGVPGLLLYLLLGLVLGSAFPDLHVSDAQLATVLGYSALVLILAQGGLTTRVEQLRPVMWPAITMASVGVAVSIAIVAIPLVWLLDVSLQNAILIGAVLAATDAAAVFSVMRRMHISLRVRTLLEAEAGFNDAPVVVLVSIVSSGSLDDGSWWQVPLLVVAELIGGALVGLAVGYAGRWLLPRLALPAVGLYPIAALALLVGAYGLADVVHSSGFLAVYVSAVIIGSAARLPHRRSIIGFADGLAWIAEIGLFFMLGALADVQSLPDALPYALVVAAIILLLARPLAALVALLPFRLPRQTIAFAGIAGLRGAVPIVFAAIPLGLGVPGGRLVFDVTLIVVLILIIVQVPLIRLAGTRLGVVTVEEAVELEVEAAPLDGMAAQVLGVEVPADSHLVGTFVTELGLPEGSVVALIVRGERAVAPDVHTRVRAGDRLLLVTTEEARAATEERMRDVSRRGRLARWLQGS